MWEIEVHIDTEEGNIKTKKCWIPIRIPLALGVIQLQGSNEANDLRNNKEEDDIA